MAKFGQLFRTKSLDALVAVGTAAGGHTTAPFRPGAGPGLMLSFTITAIVCAFTALCYAEFASMVPVSGSAYTFAHGTLSGCFSAWSFISLTAIATAACVIPDTSTTCRRRRR